MQHLRQRRYSARRKSTSASLRVNLIIWLEMDAATPVDISIEGDKPTTDL